MLNRVCLICSILCPWPCTSCTTPWIVNAVSTTAWRTSCLNYSNLGVYVCNMCHRSEVLRNIYSCVLFVALRVIRHSSRAHVVQWSQDLNGVLTAPFFLVLILSSWLTFSTSDFLSSLLYLIITFLLRQIMIPFLCSHPISEVFEDPPLDHPILWDNFWWSRQSLSPVLPSLRLNTHDPTHELSHIVRWECILRLPSVLLLSTCCPSRNPCVSQRSATWPTRVLSVSRLACRVNNSCRIWVTGSSCAAALLSCSIQMVWWNKSWSGAVPRTYGPIDLLGAYGPVGPLGVRRPVGPLVASECRGVESEDGTWGKRIQHYNATPPALQVLLAPQNPVQLVLP